MSRARPAWRDRARCIGSDPELFFPVGTGEASVRQTEEALAICSECPVQPACLDWALNHQVLYGVWGGATEQDRQLSHRHRLRTPPGVTVRLMLRLGLDSPGLR